MAALGLAGLNMTEWAEQHEVTQSHLSHVLAGRRDSKTLDEKIAAFTEKMLRNVA